MGRGRSSLKTPGRHIAVITTASLPWRTGTAVNPLLRAAYLAHILKNSKITLLVPWLAKSEQGIVYPDGLEFGNPDEQADWVRAWVEKRTSFPCKFDIKFYPGIYDASFLSIFPVGDPTYYIPDEEADVAILEEPEHLTWFHHGRRYTEKFNHVVGIMHTNYIDYIRRGAPGTAGGPVAARIVKMANWRMCDIHTHKVIKLSDAVQNLPRQSTHFVHGVSPAFLAVGDKMAAAQKGKEGESLHTVGVLEIQDSLRKGEKRLLQSSAVSNGPADSLKTVAPDDAAHSGKTAHVGPSTKTVKEEPASAGGEPAQNGGKLDEAFAPGRTPQQNGTAADSGELAAGKMADAPVSGDKEEASSYQFTRGAYFIGKAVWGKGYTELLDLLLAHKEAHNTNLPVDVFGTGEDLEDIKERADDRQLAVSFLGARDHLDDAIHPYRVFINPSTSDVVATTSAEALAMGKWLVCPEHPSNAFFSTFENTLIYHTPEEFSEQLEFAENNSPKALKQEDRNRLTWEDATERLLDVATIEEDEWPGPLTRLKDWLTWRLIYAGNGIEPVRWIVGAGRHTRRNPRSLTEFDPRAKTTYRDAWEPNHASLHLSQGYPPPRLL
ncbi:g9559 [Coccomyxa elongata]